MERILWIEDEGKIELIQFKRPLVREGYSVDIASDATEAVQLLKEKRYDALVFDLIIPCGENFESDEYYVGLDLLKKLINEKINGIVKYDPSQIMVFTVVNAPDAHKKIKDLGVETISVKSRTELTDLKEQVDALLGKSQIGEI